MKLGLGLQRCCRNQEIARRFRTVAARSLLQAAVGGGEAKVQQFCKTAAVGGEEGESPGRHQNLRGSVLLLRLGSQPPPVELKVCFRERKQMEISPDTSIPNVIAYSGS